MSLSTAYEIMFIVNECLSMVYEDLSMKCSEGNQPEDGGLMDTATGLARGLRWGLVESLVILL